jgi:hypothetical protein
MKTDSSIEFDVAEVLDYEYTYQYIDPTRSDTNVNSLFGIKVKSCHSYFNAKPFIAKPANINSKNIPVIGEMVLLFRTFNQVSNSNLRRETWYYLSTVDVQSSINSNPIPGISDKQITQTQLDEYKPGKTFEFKTVSPIQPYEGDIIVEGRFGNSLRFGSTVKTGGSYYKQPTWSGDISSDTLISNPIIILSNGQNNQTQKKFVVEDINSDNASLYLTSTQNINLKLNNTLRTVRDSVTQFSKSQLIGTADRIILKAKTDSVALDSAQSIELNSPLLSIGVKQNKEPGLHTEAVEDLFELIFDVLIYGLQDSNQAPVTISNPEFIRLKNQIMTRLKNKSIKQDKF